MGAPDLAESQLGERDRRGDRKAEAEKEDGRREEATGERGSPPAAQTEEPEPQAGPRDEPARNKERQRPVGVAERRGQLQRVPVGPVRHRGGQEGGGEVGEERGGELLQPDRPDGEGEGQTDERQHSSALQQHASQ